MPELTSKMKLWEVKEGIVVISEALLQGKYSNKDLCIQLAALRELCRKEALIERLVGIGGEE